MTITLNHVSCLLHFPVCGKFLDHSSPMSNEEGADLLNKQLGLDLEET